MAFINPYIHFNGNAEEAFTFYKSLECLQTNLVFSGWWTLTQNRTDKVTKEKQRTAKKRLCYRGLDIVLPKQNTLTI